MLVVREKALFEFNRADITHDGQGTLDAVVRTLAGTPGEIRIIGHADTCGSEAHNLDLSLRRAQAVADGLVTRHIDRARLKVEGAGEAGVTGPTDPCNQPAQRFVELRFG